MDPMMVGLVGLLLMLVLIFIGLPLPVTFFVLGMAGITLLKGWSTAIGVLIEVPFPSLSSFEWAVIPLFAMMGMVLFECGVADEIFLATRQWIGHFAGGLAAAVSGACAFMGTMTGSGWATTAVMSKLAYPEMRRFNYQPDLALAVCASSGTVAMMIPPSIVIVMFAVLAEQSIGACLLAGFLPGFMSMVIYMLMILVRARFNPGLGPPLPPAVWRARFTSLRYLVPAVIMMITIIGGIYFGVFTATEAAGMGALIAFVVVLAMRRLTWARLKNIIFETLRLSVMLLILLMTAIGFYNRFLNVSGITIWFTKMALGIPSRWITLTLMFGIMFIFGMFVGSPLAYVTLPVFAPVVEGMGFSVIWFVILTVKMMETGSITPPVCVCTFIAQGITKEVPMERAYKAVWWFVLCDMVTLAIMVAFPQITLLLPSAARGV